MELKWRLTFELEILTRFENDFEFFSIRLCSESETKAPGGGLGFKRHAGQYPGCAGRRIVCLCSGEQARRFGGVRHSRHLLIGGGCVLRTELKAELVA